MAFYSTKALNENELSSVQDPDNPGVDLDQVEKDICGSDGIEAHADEVEAAQDGIIADPLEEAHMAMFESEYNFNQLMECVGLQELAAVRSGRDLMLEAVDVKAFFGKVKTMIVNAFKKITSAFKNVLTSMVAAVKGDKKFVLSNKAKITAGESADWSMKGFKFTTLTDKLASHDYLPDFKRQYDGHEFTEVKEINRGSVIKELTGVDGCDSTSELGKKLMDKYRGGDKKIELKGQISASDVINLLSTDKETATIKTSYENAKRSYKTALATIAGMERTVQSADVKSSDFACITYYSNVVRFAQNVTNVQFACLMKCAKAKRAQYRRLAVVMANAAPANVKESATVGGGIFGGAGMVGSIDFV